MNTGNLTLGSSGTFAVDVNGTTVGTGYDQANVTGTVDLGGATLNLSATSGFRAASGTTFTIINNDGTDAITNTFVGLVEGATVSVGGQNFVLSYVGGDGNDVVLTATTSSPIITGATSTTFTETLAGTFTVTVAGSPAAMFTETGNLPSGVTLNPATGILSGTPAIGSNGTYPLTITASNGVGSNATQTFTLLVNQRPQTPPTITSANNTAFIIGTVGTFTVTASGFPTPTLTESGNLPAGVTFTATTGVLSGTPNAGTTGTYTLTFTAHNGVGSDDIQTFSHGQPIRGHH